MLPVAAGLQLVAACRFPDGMTGNQKYLDMANEKYGRVREGLRPLLSRSLHLAGMDGKPNSVLFDLAKAVDLGEVTYMSTAGMEYAWHIDLDDQWDLAEWLHEYTHEPESTDFLTALPELNGGRGFGAMPSLGVSNFRSFIWECSDYKVWWLPVNEQQDVNQIVIAFNYDGVLGSCLCTDRFDEPAAGPYVAESP